MPRLTLRPLADVYGGPVFPKLWGQAWGKVIWPATLEDMKSGHKQMLNNSSTLKLNMIHKHFKRDGLRSPSENLRQGFVDLRPFTYFNGNLCSKTYLK